MLNDMAEKHKVLWKRQATPDNHIDHASFLSSLQRNANFNPYTYRSLVDLSCAITQQISAIFIFIAVFVRLREAQLNPRLLVQISILGFIIGYVLREALRYTLIGKSSPYASHMKMMKSSIVIFLALMSLAPVLRTLTAATSSDSIWALSAILFFLNLLLAEYVPRDGLAKTSLTSVLSINAAVSASVVLASRLNTDIAVFALVLFALQAFAFFPLLRHSLRASSVFFQAVMTLLLSTISLLLTASMSSAIASLYFVVLLSVTFLAPGILLWAQRYKNEIRGAWDVASPKIG